MVRGDLHPNNFIVDNFRRIYRLYFIDLDNYLSSVSLKPIMYWNLVYIASHVATDLTPQLHSEFFMLGFGLLQALVCNTIYNGCPTGIEFKDP